jgi:hypothetical protein
LAGDELNEYPNLEIFMNYYTKLEDGRIPGNFFRYTHNMRMISFWDNGVTQVGNGLLDHLTSLDHLWFDDNICIDKRAENSTEISNLIQELKVRCPYSEPETTPDNLETTTSLAIINDKPLKVLILSVFVIGLIKNL